jgi:hypothetical protein
MSKKKSRKSSRRPGIHVMSVHVKLTTLAKLDRKVVAMRKAGKKSSRSQLMVEAIESRL